MPPFVVLRIVPLIPTIVPLFASVKDTPTNLSAVPLVCGVHVAPPFMVLRIMLSKFVPLKRLPTAVPVFESVKATSLNIFAVPLVC